MRRSAAAVVLLWLTSACGAGGPVPQSPVAATHAFAAGGIAGQYIEHVVVVVQENRSFDNLFEGFPGADTSPTGLCYNAQTRQEQTMTLQPSGWAFLPPKIDLPHSFTASVVDYDKGRMDGFCNADVLPGVTAGYLAYYYMNPSLVAPYRAMAQQYVLADRMFPTEFGGSFPQHLNLIAGNDELTPHTAVATDPNATPWGCDAPAGSVVNVVNERRFLRPGPFPCFTQFKTIADSLDAAGVSWKYYAPSVRGSTGGALWNAFDAIKAVRYGSDWANVVSPETSFLTDARTSLAGVTWVIPSYTNSDHPGSNSGTGPSWVASVVNAVGRSRFWRSTAIVVLWDDWGGLYDNVPPPQLDYRGLGVRVPCIVISPYAKTGYVSHTQYEYGSILRFIEETFGLPALGPASAGYTDARAASIVDGFDFTQTPRRFHRFDAPFGERFFLTQKPSATPPDTQ